MPKRVYKSQIKVDSEKVQGEDSYVVIKRPTWADFEAAMNGAGSVEDAGEIDVGKKLIENLVVDWNWVDDDDQPLPAPNPDIIRALPFQEIQFLIENLEIKPAEEKN